MTISGELVVFLSAVASALSFLVGLWTRAAVAELKNSLLDQVHKEYMPREVCNARHGLTVLKETSGD